MFTAQPTSGNCTNWVFWYLQDLHPRAAVIFLLSYRHPRLGETALSASLNDLYFPPSLPRKQWNRGGPNRSSAGRAGLESLSMTSKSSCLAGIVLAFFLCGNVTAQAPPANLPITPDVNPDVKLDFKTDRANAASSKPSNESDTSSVLPEPPAIQSFDELRDTVANMLRDRLPEKYVNDKHWGKTKPVFDGIRLRREGLKIETERRWKQVNDGVWKRYEIELPEDRDAISLTVDRLEVVDNQRGRIVLHLETPVHLFGRVAVWERGVQLVSIHADADAKVRLALTADVGLRFDILRIPPDVVLDPRVLDARIELVDFRLKRVSQLHGPLAKHLGEGLRETIDDHVAAANATLVEKLNRQIDKQRDRLRLAWTDALSKQWSKWTADAAEQKSAADTKNRPEGSERESAGLSR
jgi:hypothetical protein